MSEHEHREIASCFMIFNSLNDEYKQIALSRLAEIYRKDMEGRL